MFRLKTYFTSMSDVMLQRRKLALLSQHPTESNLVFSIRVASAARQCEYPYDKQIEEILSTVAEQAKYKERRIAELKMMSRKASLTDLIDKVREIETIRLNEEYVSRKHVAVDTATASVNAVNVATGPSRYVANRSNSIFHSSERCFAVNLTCHNCGGVGHLLRACNQPVAPRNKQYNDNRKITNVSSSNVVRSVSS